MSDNPFEDIKNTQTPVPNIEGLVWVTQLIKYDLRGHAEVIRSFTTQAKDSDIKKVLGKKGMDFGKKKKENITKTALF